MRAKLGGFREGSEFCTSAQRGRLMAITGRKPKDDDQKVTRHALTQDWVEVPDVPFRGCECAEPGGDRCGGVHVPTIGRAPARTKRWWATLSTMPHCILWHPSDWQFAVDTAVLHAAFAKGDHARAPELRIRERMMGTTAESRRDLRIRYLSATKGPDEPPAEVSDFVAERRRRLLDGD